MQSRQQAKPPFKKYLHAAFSITDVAITDMDAKELGSTHCCLASYSPLTLWLLPSLVLDEQNKVTISQVEGISRLRLHWLWLLE